MLVSITLGDNLQACSSCVNHHTHAKLILVKNTQTPEQRAAARIRELRGAMNLSQEALAIEMRRRGYTGWQQSTIAKLEAAARPLRVNELADLAAVLRTTVPELLGETAGREWERSSALGQYFHYSDEAARLHVQWEALKSQAEQVVQDIQRYRDLAASTRQELIDLGCVEVELDGGIRTWVFPEDLPEIPDAKVVHSGKR
jgi:transcriptional regulator with XRE-family HTH domain